MTNCRTAHVRCTTSDSMVRFRNHWYGPTTKRIVELTKGAPTLKLFRPKLSICTYYLPVDKEVLKDLIRKANPRYVIEHKWQKVYAHIPE